MSRSPSRDAILDAAERVVVAVGGAHLTLDAVAREAGLSKGGVMYNFPSKHALLEAMTTRFVDGMRSRRIEIRASLPDEPASDIKALVMAFFGYGTKSKQSSAALLAAATYEPKLLAKAYEEYHDIFGDLEYGALNPTRVAIITMAAEGMELKNLLGIPLFSLSRQKVIMNEMLKLVDEWAHVKRGGRGARKAEGKRPRR